MRFKEEQCFRVLTDVFRGSGKKLQIDRQPEARTRVSDVVLVLPINADRAAGQHLALQTIHVLSFYCLPTHSPVAALCTAGTLLQHSTDKDPAVQKHFLKRP